MSHRQGQLLRCALTRCALLGARLWQVSSEGCTTRKWVFC